MTHRHVALLGIVVILLATIGAMRGTVRAAVGRQ
jgi:hypothetical protein